MKVKDLLEELKEANPEADLVFMMRDGCCDDVEFMDIEDTDYWDGIHLYTGSTSKSHPNGKFEFWFHPFWFMKTCGRSGAAKRAAEERWSRSKG